MKEYVLNSGNYTKLELIVAKKLSNKIGKVSITSDDGNIRSIFLKYDDYEHKSFPVKQNTDYTIEFNGVNCVLAYLGGSDDILEKGVRFIRFDDNGIHIYDKDNMLTAYNQKFRNQIHFAPFKNWMNDPNGLCYYKGKYHMFYQYNPKEQKWGDMHWGHAVSNDLIRWIHLPIALFPQKELYNNDHFFGGAFSGSAVVNEDCMHLFLTRSFGSSDRTWERQWQTTCVSSDGINFSHEKVIIEETPEGVGMDFRDPMVFRKDNKWYMFIAGSHDGVAAVLCYSSIDLLNWEYEGPVIKEDRFDYRVAECPDAYEIDGKFVLVAGFINRGVRSKSNYKRRDTRYYIGNFENGKFTVEYSDLVDHGKDYYAVQSFVTSERVVSIGWNNDDALKHVVEKDSSNGTMSIPREISIKNGKLYQYPIREIEKLNDKILYRGSHENFIIYEHSDNLFRMDIEISNNTNFDISLTHNDTENMQLKYNGKTLELIIYKDETEENTTIIETSIINELTVFLDRSLVEIFINKGEYAAARRYYYEDAVHEIKVWFEKPEYIKNAKVTSLKSIW
ncbi:MAG: GH32 C-terminal domain-containing protein [Caldicoprobacterales bacterium]